MNDPDMIYCEHMENKENEPRIYSRSFSLGKKRWLLVCEQCGLAMQGAILSDVVSEGVKEFLSERKARG